MFEINEKDFDSIPYFKAYIARFSESSKKQYIGKIFYFKNWLEQNRNVKNILEAQYEDVEAFFREDINKRPVKIDTKNYWRFVLNSYYEYINKIHKVKYRKIFFNPVPDADLFVFDTETDITINDLLESERIINYEEAEMILSHYYHYNFQMFIITGLLLYTGARITEIMSVLEENINLEYCLIFNLIKRTKYKAKYGVYFFPEFFIKYIKIYLEEKKELYPNDIYLFPAKKNQKKPYLSVRHVQQQLDKIAEIKNITAKHSPHKFRKLINEERRKKGVAPLDRTILLNHTPRSIEARNYLPSLKQIQDLKLIYEKTFPFPKFTPEKI